MREMSDFSRDGSYDFGGSGDVQQSAAEGAAAPASPPKEDPNEPEAVKVTIPSHNRFLLVTMAARARRVSVEASSMPATPTCRLCMT